MMAEKKLFFLIVLTATSFFFIKNFTHDTFFKINITNTNLNTKLGSNDKLNEYVLFFNSNIKSTINATKKVTFCEPRGSGYGNRLYTFFSCFVIALLTDSLMVLTAWHESRDFIDFPFDPYYETNASN